MAHHSHPLSWQPRSGLGGGHAEPRRWERQLHEAAVPPRTSVHTRNDDRPPMGTSEIDDYRDLRQSPTLTRGRSIACAGKRPRVPGPTSTLSSPNSRWRSGR